MLDTRHIHFSCWAAWIKVPWEFGFAVTAALCKAGGTHEGCSSYGSATSQSTFESSFKSKQNKDALSQCRRMEQADLVQTSRGLSFVHFACHGSICACICANQYRQVCSCISSHALWTLSCTRINHCTVNQSWHATLSCIRNSSLYCLQLLYPREGAGNPPANFDSHKAANRGSSLFFFFPLIQKYLTHFS